MHRALWAKLSQHYSKSALVTNNFNCNYLNKCLPTGSGTQSSAEKGWKTTGMSTISNNPSHNNRGSVGAQYHGGGTRCSFLLELYIQPQTHALWVSKQRRYHEQVPHAYQSHVPVHTCTPQNSALRGVVGIPLAGFHTTWIPGSTDPL